jgi:hypothetical protein
MHDKRSDKASGRQLILGVINNYKFSQISNFILSLKKTNYTGHVCLFAGHNISSYTITKLARLGVEVINYKDEPPFLPQMKYINFDFLYLFSIYVILCI